MTSCLRAGVGRTDITPPLGTPLMGYPDPYGERRAESVRDPLHATALALTGGAARAAVVSIDSTVIEDRYVAAIRSGAAERTGIDANHITVAAIQTHSAPRTQHVWGWGDLDVPYCEETMVPRAVEAIAAAVHTQVPVRVGIGVTASNVGVNRRAVGATSQPGWGQSLWGPDDPAMTVLRFESAQGTLANVVHYGAHPTVFGGTSKVISRDWPGIMVDRMEQLTCGTTLFINGAVGDIAPRTNSMAPVGDGETALWETGACAAMDAMRAWRSIKDLRDLALHCEVGTFDLPYRPLPPVEEARQRLAEAEPDKDAPGQGMCNYKHWQAVLEAHGQPLRQGKPYLQVVTALGPVAIVPFPGEPFAELVLRMRDVSPFQHTLCASTSCGNNAYLWTREAFHRGGYEPWIGRSVGAYLLAENIDDVLVEQNLEILHRLFNRVNPPIPEE